MKKNSFVWSCLVMTFFVACKQAEVVNQEAEDMRMSISASIKGQGESPKSRYAIEDGDPNTAEFAVNDAIGVFIDAKPADKWSFDGDNWASVGKIVYWPSKTKSHTFRAFYPYAEAEAYTSVPMPSLLNQDGTIESLSVCDFLVATKEQSYGTGAPVAFVKEEGGADYSFKHVSTLLQLTFQEGENLEGAILNKISLTGGNIVAPSTYSFEDNEVTLDPVDGSDVLAIGELSKELTDGQTFYFIVNEKTASSPVTLAVEYTINEKTYEAKTTSFGNDTFTGGTCQTYTITIQNDLLVVSGGTIAPWGPGTSFNDIVIDGEEKQES